MKQQFVDKLRLSKSNIIMLDKINNILEEYVNDGYTLTLRQLYYQLVSRDIIANNDKEYSKLSNILKNGRMAGIVDWASIEDRVRVPKLPYWVNGVKDAIRDTIEQYRIDRMLGQERKIEIWVEKDALSNVLYRVSSKYHIRLMVNRGYSSVSAMYDAYNRLNENDVILYFGDNDMKRTCLWLKGLPLLKYSFHSDLFTEKTASQKPDPIYISKTGKKHYFTEANNSSKIRSKTFQGIANAMAEQWSKFV